MTTGNICFYSPSNGGFYCAGRLGIPADAVQITTQQRDELLAGELAGKVIAPDAKGNPTLTDAQPLTAKQQNFLTNTQLATIDRQKIRAITDAILFGNKAKLEELEIAAAALRSKLVS